MKVSFYYFMLRGFIMRRTIKCCLIMSFLLMLMSACDNSKPTPDSNTETSLDKTNISTDNTQASSSAPIITSELTTSKVKEKSLIWSAPNGEMFYKEDASSFYGELMYFDKAIYRPSTGVYYDSYSNPEMFDEETCDFLGEPIEYDENDYLYVKSGVKICGYTVENAETIFNIKDKAYRKESGIVPLSNTIQFKDNITLSGYLWCVTEDEPTLFQKGDIYFAADSSYINMPLVNFYPTCGIIDGKNGLDKDSIVGPVIFDDSLTIDLGNLFRHYKDNESINHLIGDATSEKMLKVEITIENLELIFHDRMIGVGCSGHILEIVTLS